MQLFSGKWYILAIFGVFLWSFNVIVARYLTGVLLPWQIAFFRWVIAAAFLMPFTVKSIWIHRALLTKHLKWLVVLSAVGISFSNTFVYYAGYTVSAIEMSLFAVTGPLFIIIFARLFGGVHISAGQRAGLLLSIFGVITIILHGRFLSLGQLHFETGDIWMLASAMSFGLYSFMLSKKPPEIPQLTLLSCTLVLGALITVPFFIMDCFNNPLTMVNMRPDVLAIMVYMGVFNSLLAYLAWNTAVEKLGSIKVSVIYYLMPIFSTIEAYFILDERIYMAQVYGGLIILAGIYFSNKPRKDPVIQRP